ncbi:MAG: thioredoxin family protein [Ignavibacteriales bacterium]|nr:thioredoxin family protein [Ignavibacteriales bacterium]
MNQRDTTYAKWVGLAAAAFLVLGAVLEYWPASDSIKWLRFEEARGAAATQNKPIFVDVYADWCGPCKAMDKDVFPNDSVKNILTSRYIPAKIDGDDPVSGDTLKKQFGIRAYPTYIVLSPAGKERKRHVGFFPKTDLIKWLNDSVGVQILLWPDLQKATIVAQAQKRRIMVLILQSGDDIEAATAIIEDEEVARAIDKHFVPTLLVRGNIGEGKLLQQVGASPKTGMREVIVLENTGKAVGRFFMNFQMQYNRSLLASKLMELALKQTQ